MQYNNSCHPTLVTSPYQLFSSFFFFNDTATTEIYTLSLHDALPICSVNVSCTSAFLLPVRSSCPLLAASVRSEEHTSELQSQSNLVCRLLLEKKKRHRRSSSGRRAESPPSGSSPA